MAAGQLRRIIVIGMPRRTDAVAISSPSDVICAVARVLGFVPTDSIVVVCTHGPRHRLGLVLRFDLAVTEHVEWCVEAITARTQAEGADGVIIVMFADSAPVGAVLPFDDLADRLADELDDVLVDMFLVADGRWWSYCCDDVRCCGREGNPLDPLSPGVAAVAAAYALEGHGVLPDRDSLVRSLSFDGRNAGIMLGLFGAALDRQAGETRHVRRLAVQTLLTQLGAQLRDPRFELRDEDAAELAALCEDVVIRDHVLVRARKRRERELLLRVLLGVARRIPPPLDCPICATLAWVAYAAGDGAIANIALDRALASNPAYSLALLIRDALDRQVPPDVLRAVMREADQDLRGRSAAG